jgi:hypothetical protein
LKTVSVNNFFQATDETTLHTRSFLFLFHKIAGASNFIVASILLAARKA